MLSTLQNSHWLPWSDFRKIHFLGWKPELTFHTPIQFGDICCRVLCTCRRIYKVLLMKQFYWSTARPLRSKQSFCQNQVTLTDNNKPQMTAVSMFMSKLVKLMDKTPLGIGYGWCQCFLQVDWWPTFWKEEQQLTAASESWTEHGS